VFDPVKLSICIPVYKEEENINEYVRRLTPLLEKWVTDYEIIFALDPSPDGSEAAIQRWHVSNPRIKGLLFSRRAGQPRATLAALELSTGDAVVVTDVDMQDPPELIPQMIEKFHQGFDVVMAQRTSRKGETWLKRLISWLGYKLINRIADVEIPPNTGDFRLMSRRVVNEVVRLRETHGFLRGMVALVGFRQTLIPFERPERFAGSGNYSRLWGSIRIGMNGVVCFSNRVLNVSTIAGFAIAAGAFVMAVVYFILKVMGHPFPMGNPTIVILVLFLGGVQLVSVGILGEYIGRIYDEVKGRPRYILDKKIGL
jgi:glycosyltransferase involved in cell wall biosynthesis